MDSGLEGHMPSKTTTVITARVKNRTAVILNDYAEDCKLSVQQLIEKVAEALSVGDIAIVDGNIIGYENRERGVTPIEMGILKEESIDIRGLHLDRFVEALRDKGFPDRVIRERVDYLVDEIRDGSRYNSRRDVGEWGC